MRVGTNENVKENDQNIENISVDVNEATLQEEKVVQEEATTKEEKPLTFQELLESNKEYQKEFDRRMSKGIDTFKENYEKEYQQKLEAEKNEAEKLAKMNAEQKLTYAKEQAEKEKEEAYKELNAYKLKDQAFTIAKEKNIDVNLLELINFGNETADGVNNKLEVIKTTFDKALEKAINERLKQGTPKDYGKAKTEEDPYLRGFKNA